MAVDAGLAVGISIAFVNGRGEGSRSDSSNNGQDGASIYPLTPDEETLLASVLEKSAGCEVNKESAMCSNPPPPSGGSAEQQDAQHFRGTTHYAQSLNSVRNHIAMRFRCAKEAVAKALGLSHLNYDMGSSGMGPKCGRPYDMPIPYDMGSKPCLDSRFLRHSRESGNPVWGIESGSGFQPLEEDVWESIVIYEYDVQTGGVKVSLRKELLEEFPEAQTEPIHVHTAQEMDPSATGEYIIAIAVIKKQESEYGIWKSE